MPEQPQWSERTLDMPPQDPWAEAPTTPAPVAPSAQPGTRPFGDPPPGASPFSQGRAQVSPRPQRVAAEHEPTGVGWPGVEPPATPTISWRWSELRRGGEWTTAAVLFAFVCWGIWAIAGGGDSLLTPIIVFLVTLAVAAGVFCLARVVGHLVLERQLGRVRRTARGSHLVTALFLTGVGIAHLQQTQWVMSAFHWITGLFG
jgi:hypothetical protein